MWGSWPYITLWNALLLRLSGHHHPCTSSTKAWIVFWFGDGRTGKVFGLEKICEANLHTFIQKLKFQFSLEHQVLFMIHLFCHCLRSVQQIDAGIRSAVRLASHGPTRWFLASKTNMLMLFIVSNSKHCFLVRPGVAFLLLVAMPFASSVLVRLEVERCTCS